MAVSTSRGVELIGMIVVLLLSSVLQSTKFSLDRKSLSGWWSLLRLGLPNLVRKI